MNNYDVIIIGAGINGLTAASILGKKGKSAVSYTHLTLPTSDLV